MITRIELTNWRSFAHAELLINPVTVLIGANDSGKSNLLEGLWFLSKLPTSRTLDGIVQVGTDTRELRGSSADIIRQGALRATLRVELDERLRGHSVRVVYSITIGIRSRSLYVAQESALLTWPDGPYQDLEIFRTIGKGPSHKKYKFVPADKGPGRPPHVPFDDTRPVLTQITPDQLDDYPEAGLALITEALIRLQTFDPQPARMRAYANRSDRLDADAANIAGFLAELPRGRKAAIEEIIAVQLAQLLEGGVSRVYAKVIQPVGVDAGLVAQRDLPNGKPQSFSADLLSDGTLRYIALIVATATAPPGSLLALEEVDDGLHPARARQLVDFVIEQAQSRSVDLLLTTHNETVLNAFGPEIVPFTYVIRRSPVSGASELHRISELDRLPQLLGLGGVGAMAASGRLNEILP